MEMLSSYLAGFITLGVIFVVGLITPGPDLAVTMQNSMRGNRLTALSSAMGTTMGFCFHATYTLLGLAFVLKNNPSLFFAFQLLGGAYFCYLGYMAFKDSMTNRNVLSFTDGSTALTPFQAFRKGFFTNALNPMVTLMFISAFSEILTPETPAYIKGLFGFEAVFLCLLWFGIVAVSFSHPRVQHFYQKAAKWIERFAGSVLVMLGAKLAFYTMP